jgi:large subunit ribosomal protein L21
MYCRLPFEYLTPQACSEMLVFLSPSNETTYLFPKWEFSRKSNVALLLQRSLHNFSALTPVTPFDGITYRQNRQKTRKSFIALLLPHVFAVSPLLRYSYKKMGVGGMPAFVGPFPLAAAWAASEDRTRFRENWPGAFLRMSSNDPSELKGANGMNVRAKQISRRGLTPLAASPYNGRFRIPFGGTMYAVIRSGGKQYRVTPGDTVRVEKLEGKAGGKVTFEEVLAVRTDESKLVTGKDAAGAKVVGKIVRQMRGPKVRVMKYKTGGQYKIFRGHRQDYTAVQIGEISL